MSINTANLLLAHEWLEKTGGSENTFEQMIQVAPTARVACLWNNAPERFPTAEESWLARTRIRNSKAASLAFMPSAWRRVDLDEIDTVVASSHAFSHHLAGRAARMGKRAFAYVYSPPRYLWAPDLDVRGQGPMGRIGRGVFKRVDISGVHGDVTYVGISNFVAARMRDSWGVEAQVIHPPVNTRGIGGVADWSTYLGPNELEALASLPQEFVLGASRLIEYKRLDVAMKVGESLGLPVVIAGDGPSSDQLRAAAKSMAVPVHFVGRVSDAFLYTLYQRTQLFVFMAIEDFGIMPVEAMALGTRTLVRDIGGTREVTDLLGSGTTANPESADELAAQARHALEAPAPDSAAVAKAFSVDTFRAEFAKLIS